MFVIYIYVGTVFVVIRGTISCKELKSFGETVEMKLEKRKGGCESLSLIKFCVGVLAMGFGFGFANLIFYCKDEWTKRKIREGFG